VKHLLHLQTINLKTVGLAAFAALMVPTAAMAQIQTYYRSGVWDAFSGRNDKGGAVCGIGNTNPSDNRRVSIRFDIGDTDTIISASKPDWSIPDGTTVTVVTQIGLNTPWTQQGTGHGHSISWSLDRNATQPFDQQFRSASLMTLTFPDGNEPPWSVPLIGSSAISATFARCIRDLTSQVQAAQAAGVKTPPAAQGPTQPFAPAASGAQTPADAQTPAGQPADNQPAAGTTQPNAAQPNAAQPNATQPNAAQPAH
jgi:hypothetical protein